MRCRAIRPTSAKATGARLYDESRRNKVLVPARDEALKALNKTDWNHYVVRATGDKINLDLNGKRSVEYHETDAGHRPVRTAGGADPRRRADGGPVQGRDDSAAAHARRPRTRPQPGFHLRTVKTDQGERKYTVYVPEGYDGSQGVSR